MNSVCGFGWKVMCVFALGVGGLKRGLWFGVGLSMMSIRNEQGPRICDTGNAMGDKTCQYWEVKHTCG